MQKTLRLERTTLPDFTDLGLRDTIERYFGFLDILKLPQRIGPHLEIISDEESFLRCMRIRSDVYKAAGLSDEFSDPVEGFLFDPYDTNALQFAYRCEDGNIAGCIRVILNSPLGLPTQDKWEDFSVMSRYISIAEVSKLAILPQYRRINDREIFRTLHSGAYSLSKRFNIERFLISMSNAHLPWYLSWGGIELVNELEGYGKIKEKSAVVLWNPRHASEHYLRQYASQLYQNDS